MPIAILLAAQLPQAPPRPRPGALAPLPVAISVTAKTAAGETRLNVATGKLPTERPLATIRAGEAPQLRWSVRNNDPRLPVKDVVIHFLITREDSAGQPIAAGLQKGTVLDNVMGTTLRAKAATSGAYNTAVHEPGFYLVELELLDPDGNRRQYAAMDLEVK